MLISDAPTFQLGLFGAPINEALFPFIPLFLPFTPHFMSLAKFFLKSAAYCLS